MAIDQRIIVTEPIAKEAIQWLSQRAIVQQIDVSDPGFDNAITQATGLIVRTYTDVDRHLLTRGRRLRVVGRAGTGLDNIDIEACHECGIKVVNTPDANRQAVVEYVTSIIATFFRALPPRIDQVHTDEQWVTARHAAIAPKQMSESTLGILGLGAIGKRVAAVASAIGFTVQYYDVKQIAPASRHGAHPVDFETVLSTSDALTVHVDGRSSNTHLLNAGNLPSLLPTALLINTARGLVIDSTALAETLCATPGITAVLDVHEQEPILETNPLMGLPNAQLFPHAASRTAAAQRAMSWVVRDVWNVLDGDSSDCLTTS
jgi:D-3-phosphoglycerate dehydrogenase / 2-oxoglutarate reductase